MSILGSDLKWYLSGGGGNTDPNAALGGAISSTEVVAASLNNLFDDLAGSEAYSDTEYRAVYLKNTHGSLSLTTPYIWIYTQPTKGVTFAIALAGEGKTATIETVANESTAPVGEAFTSPSSEPTGLLLPDLAAADYHGIWIRRTTGNAIRFANNSATIRVRGSST